ncbi:OmpH family outer membrane protein [Aequorivita sp. SDUM287046]|uniref:OmpH family outer membrane protein n=1 Tax=Aequorivita aurantiaca TaxID=3053356 RepID=A0ABT8DLL6_9FLAO|nr:OmpH family outer membrane protein [Aequorivita aurantiaca]MDN3724909.1 OmpH family outer membrane protein [Aequorivita aurantiaca]
MKFIKIAIFFISLTTFAQGKVGAVDIEYILSKMPELISVETEIQTYGAQLDTDLNKKLEEYKKLVETYKQSEATFTEAQKTEKQTEIITMEQEIQKFQQNGAKLMDIKQTEALKPLYQKIGVALEKVAKAQNYTQVMQTTQDMVYLDPEYDLTVPILLELGITINAGEAGK